jgi:DNA-binding MarR family transcriptional regulator
MSSTSSSSRFTKPAREGSTFGPPLIGALLRMPLQVVQGRMLERLHEAGFADLEAAHLTVFQYPGPQGSRPTELAARLRMSKQALNYLLGQLERSGYLERRPDTDDQRSKRITLTERGTAIVPVIRDAVAEIEREWQAALGPERFTQLRDVLHDLNQLIET